MSMALALFGIESYLRQQYGWKPKQCGVQHRCIPPNSAGQFFVAIDDAGVEGGPEETNALTEVCNIEIGVWRRPGHLSQADMLGKLKLPDDPYIAGILTAAKLERMAMVPEVGQQAGGLHKNYGLMNYINTLFGLPNEELGAGFNEPLSFKGFSRFEPIIASDAKGADAFYGRRLRFRGLKRIQKPTVGAG